MFKTVDLFSGIGGISFALQELLDVLLYCDIDENAQSVLKSRMSTNDIQKAPIVSDVREMEKIKSIIGLSDVDLMLSSSSCVGFSSAGSRRGLENEETAFMLDTILLVDQIRPKMVFMENVPGIVKINNGSDLDYLITEMNKLGYDTKWEIHSASDVGGWHLRKRWFCLCVSKDYNMVQLPVSTRDRYESWGTNIGLDKSKLYTVGDRQRLRLLGNSVVPDCVRTAFYSLYSNYMNIVFSPFTTGFVASKNIVIVLDPNKEGIIPSVKKRIRTSKLITVPKTLKCYPTPRSKNITSSSILTDRCSRDLGTVVKFEMGVEWKKKYIISPVFVEILMGYPRNYTCIDVDESNKCLV